MKRLTLILVVLAAVVAAPAAAGVRTASSLIVQDHGAIARPTRRHCVASSPRSAPTL